MTKRKEKRKARKQEISVDTSKKGTCAGYG